MHKYHFTVFLSGLSEITEDASHALFEAGCDDGSPASCDGSVWVNFHRDARSLEEAIRSAVANIREAGLEPLRVEIDRDDLLELVEMPSEARA